MAAMLATGVAGCGATASPPAQATSPTPVAGSSVPASSSGTFDACALLPTDELSGIAGSGMQATPMPIAGWIAGQCAWSGSKAAFFVSVGSAESLRAAGDPGAPDAKAKLAQFREKASSTGTPKDLAGFGDGAVLAKTGIGAYKGGTYIEVTRLKVTDDQLIEIAKLAVANL